MNVEPTSVGHDVRLAFVVAGLGLKPIPAYDVVNLRLGTQIDALDLSLFVDNLTNSQPALELSSSTYYDPQDWQNATLRPRTYGLTVTWRK